jgi:hypothetical protein
MTATIRVTRIRKIICLVGVAGASIVSLGFSALLLGLWRFNRLVRRDVEVLLAQAAVPREAAIVTEEMFQELPKPVQRYLKYTGIVGKPFVNTVRLEQRGTMHPSPQGASIPLKAEEHYTVRPPGFVWSVRMQKGPLPIAVGRDMYSGGEGGMLVRAGSLFTVVDAGGEEMDQGSMMRYLSEMIWFPTAFLGENVSFEPVDENSVRVTLTDGGRSATGTMFFDEEGHFTDFVATRYRTVEGGYEFETWSTPAYEYGELAGLRLLIRGGDLEAGGGRPQVCRHHHRLSRVRYPRSVTPTSPGDGQVTWCCYVVS